MPVDILAAAVIKLCQVLSTRPDLIPPQYVARMQSLQDREAPIPLDVVRGR